MVLAIGVFFTRSSIPCAVSAIERNFLYAVAAFLFGGLLSASFSAHKELAIQPLLILIAGCLLMPLAASALRGRSDWLIHGIAISGYIVAAVAIANRFGFDVFTPFGLHPSYSGGRMQISSMLGNPNFVASYLATSAPALLYLALRPSIKAWVWRLGLAGSFASIWWTQSRIGLLCFFVALALPLLARSRKQRWIAIGAVLVLFAASASLVNRTNPRSLTTASTGRTFLWRVSLADGVHLLGDGPGTFYYTYPERMGRWFAAHPDGSLLPFADMQEHAHNDFLEFLVSTGVLGAAALLATLGIGVGSLLQRVTSDPRAPFALAGIVALLLGACFDFPLQRAETWALLWLWFAFAFLDLNRRVIRFRERATVLAPASALGIVLLVVVMRPAIASYHVHEGLAWEAQSSDQRAVEEYAAALRWDRTNADAEFYLARALANSGRTQDALEQARIAQYWLDEPDLWELRARILVQMGHKQAALAELDDGLRRFPYSSLLASARSEISAEPEK